VRVSVLGPLALTVNGEPVAVPGQMDRAVLARLVLAEGRAVSADSLAEMLWPDERPYSARNALQVKISRLRALLGSEGRRLEHADGSYRLRLDADQTDAGVFAGLVDTARQELAAGRPRDAAATLARALGMWRGDPLADLARYPRVDASCQRLRELALCARELHAEALTADPAARGDAVAALRELLAEEPLRPRARLLLMTALEASGRRGEALAVYDTGRRLLAEAQGLEPSPEMRAAFEAMLDAERVAAHRARDGAGPPTGAAPANLLETTRWLADQGDVEGGLRLAVAGAWWWWLGGKRHSGRDLLEELLGRPARHGVDDVLRIRAQAWAGALRLDASGPADALDRTEGALRRLGAEAWDERDALAAVLVAERLYERGDHRRADALARAARAACERAGSAWVLNVAVAVGAKGRLLRGDIGGAERAAAGQLTVFLDAGDDAGTVFCLDLLGYAAEVRGRLDEAAARHRRALEVSRHIGCPDWEARQLTRLGNVRVLAGRPGGVALLSEAVVLSESLGSRSAEALARNGLGAALSLEGDSAHAQDEHLRALEWYTATGSESGIAYTSGRLGALHGAGGRLEGLAWSRRSVGLAVATRDPRAVAFGLEAVALTAPDAPAAARALGAARSLRERVGAPLPEVQSRALRVRQQWMVQALRAALVPTMRRAAEDAAAIAEEMSAPSPG
jgi:DNA-binding SARP family transcriptional activator